MAHGSEFERLLDAHVAAAGVRVPPPPVPPPLFDGRPDPALRFVMWGGGVPPVWPKGRTLPRGVSPLAEGGAWGWATDPAPTPPPVPPLTPPSGARPPRGRNLRTVRAVAPADRAAVETMRRAGAELGDEYTLDELKLAYRRLAFRYHPDQHPGADPVERARLSASFARVHAAYRQLGRAFLS